MIWLIAATAIWGFSFGLIKGMTSGVNPFDLGLIRSLIAAAFFMPWFIRQNSNHNIERHNKRDILRASICGFIQVGLMYGPYLLAFKYLKAYEVALFTMTTPIISAIIMAIALRDPYFKLLGAAAIACIGGFIVAWKDLSSEEIKAGIVLVQASNILFALGLTLWVKWTKDREIDQKSIMFPYFCGAAVGAGLLAAIFGGEFRVYTSTEWMVFLWLGAVASGLGFFMWNRGALNVTAAALAAANNLKLPVAILISLVVFGEQADLRTLLPGLAVIFVALRLASGSPQTK